MTMLKTNYGNLDQQIVDYLGWLSLMSTLEESPVAQRFG
jgi:hypothetical protein